MPPRRELEVQAAWHQQASRATVEWWGRRGMAQWTRLCSCAGRVRMHACQLAWSTCSLLQVHASKVTTLAFSGGAGGEDDKLWCGCDAAAPKPVEEDGEEPPIAKIRCLVSAGGRCPYLHITSSDAPAITLLQISAPPCHRPCLHVKDGEGVQLEEKAPACNVRLLLPHSDAEGVLCVTGDGALLTLNGNGGVQSSTGLPGMPAAAAASGGSQKDGSAACQAAESNGGAGEPEAEQQAGGDAGTDGGGLQGPEFVAEAGYRGHRCSFVPPRS